MKDEIHLMDLVRLSVQSIWRNKIIIAIISVIFLIIGILYASTQPVTNWYYASATIYSAIYGSYQESVTVSNAIDEYSGVLSSAKVCQRAEALIGDSNITATDIQRMISSKVNSTSTIMTVSTYSDNPETSVKVANAVAEAFVIEIQGITGSDAIQILDESQTAYLSSNGYSDLVKRVFTITIAGFVLGCVFFVGREILTDKIKTVDQCMGAMGDELLGVMPLIEEKEKKK